MLSARWLRPKEIEAEQSSREHGVYAWIESTLPAPARLGDGPPLGGRRWSWRSSFLATIPLGIVANKNFLPLDDESQFEVLVRAPEGSSLESTKTILESIAQAGARAPGGRVHAR